MASTGRGTDWLEDGTCARAGVVFLGGWLFLSAFCWHHTGLAATITWTIGALTVGVGLLAHLLPRCLWVCAGLGAWIFLAALVVPHWSAFTVWNNLVVGALILWLSMNPKLGPPTAP